MSSPLRVRYAPSPTGHLHIGGARTALFDYLAARHSGGAFVIRFEDTDRTRHVESGIQDQLDGLKWLGLDWDESIDVGGPYAPYLQTERLALYRPYVEQLIRTGCAYHCYCSEAELDAERLAQEARGETPKYSGRCRELAEEQRRQLVEEGRKPTVRFRVPEHRIIEIEDRVRGHVEFDSDGIGDFIIVRPDGIPTYNFAVVLDDHMMEINLIIRGEEHLTNTPRQILIYEALGFSLPEFAHLSLILNQDRKKMSKRDESIVQFVEQYREMGYLPEALLNYIALLGWSPTGETEIFSKDELIAQFSLERVSKSPAVFDTDKLNWMNNHYIKHADVPRIVELVLPHLRQAGFVPEHPDSARREWLSDLTALLKEKLRYAADIVPLSAMFFSSSLELEEEARQILAEDHVSAVLGHFLSLLEQSREAFQPETVKSLIKQVQTDTGYKGKQLFMPIRAALTGQTHGPDLNQTLYLLGKEKVMERLKSRVH